MTERCGLFARFIGYLLWSAAQANAAVLIQYEFSQEECRGGAVKDVTGGDRYFGEMVLDNSTTSCLPGIGIERTPESPGSPGASSVGNTSFLREELFRDASSPGRFSLELWLSIDSMPCENFCTTPVVTIGERGVSLDDDCQENMGMMITYWTESGDFGARFQSTRSACEKLWSGAMQPTANMGYAFHLVLTADRREYFGDPYAYFEWYINGTRVATDLNKYVPPEVMMTLWDPDFNLQILDWSRQTPSSFYTEGPGIKIFFLAIHNEALERTEVFSRYSARLPTSTPVVRDNTVGVAEDGELGDHYEAPESYLQVFPESELQLVPLDVYDSDNDPATPNYDNNTSPRVFVSTLPFPGTLVNSSGEDIVSAPFEVFGNNDGIFAVKYRPILNDFSTHEAGNDSVLYANFSFYAIDEESDTRSHTNATVSIYVFSKNDPPEASNASYDVYAGTRHNIISLHGIDMDAYDDVHGAAIVEQPARGTLFQVFDNGSASNVIVATGELLWRQSVAYEHGILWLHSNSPAEQTVGSDIFSFKVFDSHSNFSVPSVINITVVTGVSAIGDGSLSECYEEADCDVWLHGSAIDDSQGNLSVTITGRTAYGSLFDAVSNASIEVGSTLSNYVTYPYESGASVTYRPPMDFFTYPATEWNGNQLPQLGEFVRLSFYVSIELGNAKISSAEVTLELKVINVNDHSTVTCGEDILLTQATGVVGDDLEFDYARPDRLFIYNFFITEKDKGVDPVRVSVEVESGYLTLNDTLGSRVSFDYQCSGTREWRCKGDGIYARSMVFIGAPKDVQNVLNGMLFISYERNSMDNMTITIFDGLEGDCIWEFPTSSVRPVCYSSSCSLMINVTDTWLGEDDSGGGDPLLVLNVYEFLALFALISALIGIVMCYCIKALGFLACYCCRRRKHRRITAGQEVATPPALRRASNMFTTSRRMPANIPAGRAEKEAAAQEPDAVPSTLAGKCPLLGLGLFRCCNTMFVGRSSVAATQDIPRDHIELSEELVWEDN